MFKRHLRPLSVLLLLCVLCLAVFSACVGTDTPADETASSADSTPQEPADTDIRPEIIDLNGREIRVYCFEFGSATDTILGYTGEILYSDEENATAVDTAKKATIDRIEQDYNCTITGDLEPNPDTFYNTVFEGVMTGKPAYDLLFTSSSRYTAMVNNDLLTDLNSISTLHLSNSWWDQNAVKQLSIANRLFYVCGDINTYDNLGTWCVLFNKNLKDGLQITQDFYQMVNDHTWTLDNFMAICKGVTGDVTGEGTVDEFDRWALGTERYNIFVQVLGGGLHVVEKDTQTDLPYITVANQPARTYSALDKIINFYNGGEVMIADSAVYEAKYPNNCWENTVNKAFVDGRELFYMCGLINVAAFRTMDDVFGILPIPMTFENQDNYYHTVSTTNSSYMAIPFGAEKLEELGVVVEALAMESQKRVTPEFYDIQLKYRDARDTESAEMLDLIFATRSFDLGPIYNWGGLMNGYVVADTNYASRFDSVLPAAQKAMEETIEQMREHID